MDMQRRGIVAAVPAILAGAAGLARSAHGRETATSVTFKPAEDLSPQERARHERTMARALDLVGTSGAPFAALLVDRRSGEVLCEGINQRRDNPTLHGEIVAINACAAMHAPVPWSELVLYTTAEPCPMCMSATVWARIPEVVYGTSIETLARLGLNQIRLDSPTVAAAAPFYSCAIIGGILRDRADTMYREWLASRSR